MSQTATYDTFLSHSHEDAELVELIAHKLEEEHALRVWLDKWILIPGETLRQELSKGLDNSKTCVVIIGNDTQKGWFEEEINKAIDKQTRDKSFRVIPVLLPNANPRFVQDFLENRRYVRFFEKIEELRAFHELVCGIKGIPPGRDYSQIQSNNSTLSLKKDLKQVNQLYSERLIDKSVKIEFQKTLVQEILKAERNGK